MGAKAWVFAVALALTAIAPAQSRPAASPRLQAIYRAIQNRLDGQSDAWFDKGDFPKTVQLLRLSAAMQPQDYEIATNLGWMLENIHRNEEALAVYVRFRKLNVGQADAAYPEANFYFAKKAYAKVPHLLEPTLQMRPHANSFRILAHSYERMNMYADAKRVWTKYLALNPNDGAARANLKRVQEKLRAGAK